MTLQVWKNFSVGQLAGTLSESATVVDLETNHGARFPNAPFVATIHNSTDYSDSAAAYWGGACELILVTQNPTASQFGVVVRGHEGTTPLAFSDDEKTYNIQHVISADYLARSLRRDRETNETAAQYLSNGLVVRSTGGVCIGRPTGGEHSSGGFGLTVDDGLAIETGPFCLSVGPVLVPAGSAPNQTITVSENCHAIDTSAGAAGVSTINGGIQGMVCYLNPSSGAFDVVVEQGGNIKLSGNSSQTLIQNADVFCAIYRGTTWRQVSVGINNQ